MKNIVLLLFNIVICSQLLGFVSPLVHEAPVAKTLWNERCQKNTFALNDCNWCKCGANHQYVCRARACREVDMFGHFNDAIKDINVGMEGHGVWRSTQAACEPGVHYHRDKLFCICGEDGTWPNPVCRDIFRILHAVEVPKNNEQDKCAPTKLYLIGCNVCFCPSTGRIDSTLCTKKICDANDPVLNTESKAETAVSGQDFYAECKKDLIYQLGCRTCTCLRNNRLLCGDCKGPATNKSKNYCKTVAPFQIFNIECNMCYCDRNNNMICSAKRCLGKPEKSLRRFIDIDDRYIKLVDAPLDDRDCKIGTKYKKGCNTCVCLENESGVKMFACTSRSCVDKSLVAEVTSDCVLHSSYELNCLKCQCVSANGARWQWCETESRCSSTEVADDRQSLDTLHGYCEPLHEYVNDCNKCLCLSDSKTLVCSDFICEQSPDPLVIDIVPLRQQGSCPNGHTYKIDCNICVCLKNGNALCTTMDCTKQNSKV